MDRFGYLTLNDTDNGKLPRLRIEAKAMVYDATTGLVPDMLEGDVFWSVYPFGAATTRKNVSQEWQTALSGSTSGHNLFYDDNITALLRVDGAVPVSPLFVKDLAGRMIYIGYGPESKGLDEWGAYAGMGIENALDVTLSVFPRRCRDVKGNMPGWELLENVFLIKFRNLDMAMEEGMPASGASLPMVGAYTRANLYPYKYRLDTFYVDGWKLPQTQMLYARWDGVSAAKAQGLGTGLLDRWEKRPANQSYEQFVEACGGEKWIEELFEQGCTLIPTFEACNGVNVVSQQFELEDFWPGRMVSGLHEMVKAVANKAPRGTILEVLSPGYVTQDTIVPAKVIVSDGSGYVSVNNDDPLPLVPNLFLPHQRTVDVWGSTWVPTHPSHFEDPALWGWDVAGTGRFLQIEGPLWDPLHYYYSCMDVVYEAVKRPMNFEDNRWLVPVPEEMQNRFYPVVPMKGFDTISEESWRRRRERQSLPFSCVTRMRDGMESATIGYHPLPVEFEYELEPFWFPDLHPVNRRHGGPPEVMADRICPVIQPKVTMNRYLKSIDGPEDARWLRDSTLLADPSQDALKNYPFLARYTEPMMDNERFAQVATFPYLAEPSPRYLRDTAQTVWAGVDGMDALESLAVGLYDAVWDMRDDGLSLVRFRHSVYRNHLTLYTAAWWYGWDVDRLLEAFNNIKQLELEGGGDVEEQPVASSRKGPAKQIALGEALDGADQGSVESY